MSSITFPSENAKGDCPGFLQGDVSKTTKGVIVLQVRVKSLFVLLLSISLSIFGHLTIMIF